MASATLCQCGCGESAPIADRTSSAKGWGRGEPLRFIHGHNRRKPQTSPSEKTCSRCGEARPAAKFYRDASKSDGLSSRCRDCVTAAACAWARSNPDRHLGRMRRWREQNPGRQTALAADYDARKRAAFVEAVDRQIVWERDEGICGICSESADRECFQVDHIVPLSRGGEHAYRNVQVAHATCNHEKRAKVVI